MAPLGLSFDMQLYPHQMPDAARLADAFPDTRVVLNHAGMPLDRTPQGRRDWEAGLKALAARPNVAVKISGLGMVDHAWSVESLRPFVLATIEAFEPRRCMFASNFPVDRLYSSFGELHIAFDTITRDFGDDREALFGGTARALYGL